MPEIAEALTVLRLVDIGAVDETDVAATLGNVYAIGLVAAEETNTATAFVSLVLVDIGAVSETDLAGTAEKLSPNSLRGEVDLMTDIDVGPVEVNIQNLYRGDAFEFPLLIKEDGVAIDVTSWTFEAQVRAKRTGAIVADFSVNDADAVNGYVIFTLTDVQTRLLTGNAYVWDIERTDVKKTIIAGKVIPKGDVTRDE